MRETLEALMRLQEIDCQLRTLEQAKGDLPLKISAMTQEIELMQALISEKLARVESQRALKRSTEAEVSMLKEKLKKYQSQLYQVKTNKEYDAITAELETTEASIDKFEFQVLETEESEKELFSEVDGLNPQLEQLRAALTEHQKELEIMSAKNADQESILMSKRQTIVETLARPILSTYERIRSGRSGIAMAFLKDGACSQCSSRIPPQRGLEIRMMSNLYVCEVCGRIIVWNENRDRPCAEAVS